MNVRVAVENAECEVGLRNIAQQVEIQSERQINEKLPARLFH